MNGKFSSVARTAAIVVPNALAVEKLLRSLGYVGAGLHDLASCADGDFDVDVIRAIRKIATIRNRSVHNEGLVMSAYDESSFHETVQFAREELEARIELRARKAGIDPAREARRQQETITNWIIAGIVFSGLIGWLVMRH